MSVNVSDNHWAGLLLTPEMTVILFTQGLSYLPCNTMHLS